MTQPSPRRRAVQAQGERRIAQLERIASQIDARAAVGRPHRYTGTVRWNYTASGDRSEVELEGGVLGWVPYDALATVALVFGDLVWELEWIGRETRGGTTRNLYRPLQLADDAVADPVRPVRVQTIAAGPVAGTWIGELLDGSAATITCTIGGSPVAHQILFASAETLTAVSIRDLPAALQRIGSMLALEAAPDRIAFSVDRADTDESVAALVPGSPATLRDDGIWYRTAPELGEVADAIVESDELNQPFVFVLRGRITLSGLVTGTQYWLGNNASVPTYGIAVDEEPERFWGYAQQKLYKAESETVAIVQLDVRPALRDLADVAEQPDEPDDGATLAYNATDKRWVLDDGSGSGGDRAPHTVLAGPTTAPDAPATFRLLEVGDLPAGPAWSVLGNWTGASSTPQWLTVVGTAPLALVWTGSTLTFAQIETDMIADFAITADKIFGGAVGTAELADGAVTPAKMDAGTALSLLGRSANSGGVRADIAAASDHQVMRRSGTAISFGPVNLAQSAAVTGALGIANGGTGATTAAAALAALSGAALGGSTTATTSYSSGSGTHTWNAASKYALVLLVGGGGGAGGGTGTTGSNSAAGGGGAAGDLVYAWLRVTGGASESYAVGAAGSNGGTGSDGTAGGNTTLGFLQANGGSGGGSAASGGKGGSSAQMDITTLTTGFGFKIPGEGGGDGHIHSITYSGGTISAVNLRWGRGGRNPSGWGAGSDGSLAATAGRIVIYEY